ncbi:hypothetical protein G6F62_013392 [Rhizopus arrhizus]|nr:hypothetical protein G6F62_013392 [Rhizopus arrhizus]
MACRRTRRPRTVGGSGALRVGADVLKKLLPHATVALSNPSWENHRAVFSAAGFEVVDYTYFDPTTHGVDFDGMLADLGKLQAGTVVLLHGWMMNGDSMLPWSLQLAESGYRVVTLDLRNHGQSGAGPSGYGTYESDDVVDVIGELRARGEITGPLYLFGVSYGAATAVFTADKLGDQVAGVVAMESRKA